MALVVSTYRLPAALKALIAAAAAARGVPVQYTPLPPYAAACAQPGVVTLGRTFSGCKMCEPLAIRMRYTDLRRRLYRRVDDQTIEDAFTLVLDLKKLK